MNKQIDAQMLRKYLTTFKKYKDGAKSRDAVLDSLFGGFDGVMGEQFGILEDMILDLISAATGIDMDSLNWFVYQTDCGNTPTKIYTNGEYVVVDSIDSFLETINPPVYIRPKMKPEEFGFGWTVSGGLNKKPKHYDDWEYAKAIKDYLDRF